LCSTQSCNLHIYICNHALNWNVFKNGYFSTLTLHCWFAQQSCISLTRENITKNHAIDKHTHTHACRQQVARSRWSLHSSVFSRGGLHATAAAVNYAVYTHLTKYYSNSAEHTFLLITINGQASTDTDKGRDTVRDQTRFQHVSINHICLCINHTKCLKWLLHYYGYDFNIKTRRYCFKKKN